LRTTVKPLLHQTKGSKPDVSLDIHQALESKEIQIKNINLTSWKQKLTERI
jgi:hypothetical protein